MKRYAKRIENENPNTTVNILAAIMPTVNLNLTPDEVDLYGQFVDDPSEIIDKFKLQALQCGLLPEVRVKN